MADYIGSTTGIMKYAKESDAQEFIIGTENSIVQHLQFECPDKRFYPLSQGLCMPQYEADDPDGCVQLCPRTGNGEGISLG